MPIQKGTQSVDTMVNDAKKPKIPGAPIGEQTMANTAALTATAGQLHDTQGVGVRSDIPPPAGSGDTNQAVQND